MTPAEVLTAAADKLEARLKHATPGPWEVFGDGGHRLTIVGGADREYGVVEDYELNPDDAHYLAAMNPLVGKALAEWLRTAARNASEHMLGWDREAVVLARLIIGGES